MLGTALYGLSFLIVGLWLAVRLSRYKLFPKELLYICSLAASLTIFSFMFFVYLLSPAMAHWLVVGFIVASPLAMASLVLACRVDPKLLQLLKQFYLPPLLITCAIFTIYSSLLYSCRLPATNLDNRRLPNQTFCAIKNLPLDNGLPQMFADFMLDHTPRAMVLDWTIADRPPLQIGATLPIEDLSRPDAWHYRANYYNLFSIFLQLSWIGAVWALFKRLKLKRGMQVAAFMGLCATQFFYINSVFVWPKFLAGALVVAGMIPFIGTPLKKPLLRYLPVASLLVSLGLLSHSGVLFTVVPFGALLIYKLWPYRKQAIKPLLLSAAIALVVLTPWQVFRGTITSSDRLVKYHFADVTSYEDKRGTLKTIVDAYRQLSFEQWVSNKIKNVETLITGNYKIRPDCSIALHISPKECYDWKALSFFSTLFALEIFAIGLGPLLYSAIRRRLDAFDKETLLLIGGSLLFWVLAMFHPGGTVVHQGSYATMIILFVLLIKHLVKYPRLLLFLAGAQLVLFYWLWVAAF